MPATLNDPAGFVPSPNNCTPPPEIWISTLSIFDIGCEAALLPFQVTLIRPASPETSEEPRSGWSGTEGPGVSIFFTADHGPNEPSSYFHLNCNG